MGIVAVDGAAVYRTRPTGDAGAAHARNWVREGKDERVVAVRAAAATFNSASIQRKIDIEGAGTAVDFPGRDRVQLHWWHRVMLRQRKGDITAVVVADGPAVRR